MCRPCRARRPPRSRCCRVSLGWCRSAGNPCHRCHRNHRRMRHTRHLHRPRLPLPPGGRPRRREPCRCRCRASCTPVAALARTRHGCPRPPGRSSWPPGAFGCGYSEPSFLLSVGIRVQSMSHFVQMVHELSTHACCKDNKPYSACTQVSPGKTAIYLEAFSTPSSVCSRLLVVVYCSGIALPGNTMAVAAQAARVASWKPQRMSFFLPG